MVVHKIAIVCPEASVSLFDRFLLESTLDLLSQSVANRYDQLQNLEVTIYTSDPIEPLPNDLSFFNVKYAIYFDTFTVFNKIYKEADFKAIINFKKYLFERRDADVILCPSGESGFLSKKGLLYSINDCFIQVFAKSKFTVFIGISKHVRFHFPFHMENFMLSLNSRKNAFLITTRDKDSYDLLSKSVNACVGFGSDLIFNNSIVRALCNKMNPLFCSCPRKLMLNLDKIPDLFINRIVNMLQMFQNHFYFFYLIVEKKSWAKYKMISNRLNITPLTPKVTSLMTKLCEESFLVITNRLHLTILAIITSNQFIAVSEQPANFCKIHSYLKESILIKNWFTIEDPDWENQFKTSLSSKCAQNSDDVSVFNDCVYASLARSDVNRKVIDFVLDSLTVDEKVAKLIRRL